MRKTGQRAFSFIAGGQLGCEEIFRCVESLQLSVPLRVNPQDAIGDTNQDIVPVKEVGPGEFILIQMRQCLEVIQNLIGQTDTPLLDRDNIQGGLSVNLTVDRFPVITLPGTIDCSRP